MLLLPIRIGLAFATCLPLGGEVALVDHLLTKFLTVPLLLTLADVVVLMLQLFFGRYMYRLLMDVPLLLVAALASVPSLWWWRLALDCAARVVALPVLRRRDPIRTARRLQWWASFTAR